MKNQSQIFDWTRFGATLRRDLSLDATKWFLRIVAVFAVSFFLICLFCWPDKYDIKNDDYSIIRMSSSTGIFLYLCMDLCVVVGAALFMENSVSPQQRLNELMLPSSTLEKYLTRIIICIIGFPLLCFASIFLAYSICYLLLMLVFGNVVNFDFINIFPFADWKYWITFLSLQATFMLGSIVWPKNSFIKTTGTLFVLFCLWIMFLTFILSNAMRGKVMSESGNDAIGYIVPALMIVWTLFCYVTAYFRMKESEIIHRL